MKAALQWLSNILVAFSIGTSVTLVVLLGMLWWKGALADDRMLGMLAALQGIKPPPPEVKSKAVDPKSEQPSIDQITNGRLLKSLDLDLRESAIDKSLGDLRTLETQIKTESVRLDNWKKSFDQRVADLQTAATDAALLELQRTLEAMAPTQAKDQIMKMLAQPDSEGDQPMNDVVAIIKAMPLDKRRKILGAFKTPPEIEKLHAVLDEIRRGTPETELLDDTRKQLQQQQNTEP
jgi:hypothetical protein